MYITSTVTEDRKLMDFVFKVIHGDAPGYFKDIFKLKNVNL